MMGDAITNADDALFGAALELADWGAITRDDLVTPAVRASLLKLRGAAARMSTELLRQAGEMERDRDFGRAITILETFAAGCTGG